MSRPAYLAASVWSEVAEVLVELGPVGSWSPSGPAWGVGAWGVDHWGSGYLTAAFRDVTTDVITFDTDSGRNGIDDPGEVGIANLMLYDPAGEHGIAGAKEKIGNLLRASAKHTASATWRPLFYGKVTDAKADESLAAPTISLRAIDMLGSVLGTDDGEALPAQSVRERLDELLDRALFPDKMRALDVDATRLLAVERPGNRMDAARGAVASAIGGTLFAVGDGSIRYEHGATNVDPSIEPDYRIGTVEGAVCPTSLALGEASSRVVNFYDWTNQDRDAPLQVAESIADSVHHYGRQASVRTDLLNADQVELAELVHSELARTAWGAEAVESCSILIHDDASAELVLAQVGELVAFDYSGADAWSSLQVIGSVAHHISAEEWSIDLKTYGPELAATWGVAQWGISTWAP